MEKIGEGLQYKVYAEEDRVRKEPKSREEMIEMAANWYDSRAEAEENVDMAIVHLREYSDRRRYCLSGQACSGTR